ncbi:MAG: acyl-phosphate glycerol 3-phosphate acyltransferase, partial [Gemmatimonadetes bacterium]|nr:acyl-phosphate glycerol 3-phosphate acyltransferase [Gemmatimonadota bacterium]
LKFRGGKGVATAAGAFLGLAPAALGLAAVVFTATLLTSRFVSLASMLGAVTLPVALAFTGAPREILVAGVAIAGLVVFRHRSNVSRILSGTESRVSFGKRGGTP